MKARILTSAVTMLGLAWGFYIFMMFEKEDFENVWRLSVMGHQLMVCILFYLWQTKGLKDGKID